MRKQDIGWANSFDYTRAMMVSSSLVIVSTPIAIKGKREFTHELSEALSKHINTLPTITTPSEFFPSLLRKMPNIILIENKFGGVDTASYAKTLHSSKLCKNVLVYAIARRKNESLEAQCSPDGLHGVIYASTPIETTVNRIVSEFKKHLKFLESQNKVDEWTTAEYETDLTLLDSAIDGKIFAGSLIYDMLGPLGLDTSHKGTEYAAIMIALSIIERTNIIKELYEITAYYERTTPGAVEKAIRYAVEQAWTRGMLYMQYALFGNTIDSEKGKPTNSEFISTVVQHILESKYSSVATYTPNSEK